MKFEKPDFRAVCCECGAPSGMLITFAFVQTAVHFCAHCACNFVGALRMRLELVQ